MNSQVESFKCIVFAQLKLNPKQLYDIKTGAELSQGFMQWLSECDENLIPLGRKAIYYSFLKIYYIKFIRKKKIVS